MSQRDAPSWAEAADAHALGEGPAPGPAPDLASAAEAQLFSAMPSMAAPVALEGDAATIDGLLDRFAQSPAAAPAASSLPKWAALVGISALALALVWGSRPDAKPAAAPAEPPAAPVSPLASPSAPEPDAPDRDPLPSTPGAALDPPAPVVEAPEAAPPREAPKKTKPKDTKPKLSAAELLAKARAARGQGDKRGAEKLYRQLHRDWPSSPEAHASRISLGQLQLSMGKARSALKSFEAYKRKGGPLLEEAYWGIVRAHDRLGSAGSRDRAIEALDARFPASAYRAQAAKLQEAP